MTRQDGKHWTDRIKRMFDLYPKTKEVENRYLALKTLLQKRYPEITENHKIQDFLKDAIYLDRKLRLMTEGMQTELKRELEDKFVQELND